MVKFNLDLSLVARLGGHSAPRNHQGMDLSQAEFVTEARVMERGLGIYKNGGAGFIKFGP